MPRIRTVKPELFKHEELYEAEVRTGLPLRLAWIGLFTIADREGRFKWRPKAIKTDILPYDVTDSSRVLDEFVTLKLLVRYRDVTGAEYGQILNWHKHQRIRNDEHKSELPNPNDCEILHPDVTSSSRERHVDVTNPHRGIGKGIGKGIGNREIELEEKNPKKEFENFEFEKNAENDFLASPASRPLDATPRMPQIIEETHQSGVLNTSLRVTPQERKKTQQRAKESQIQKVENSGQKFIAHYCEQFKLRFGVNPEISKADAGRVKRLASEWSAEKIEKYIEAYFSLPDAWLVKRRFPIDCFASKLNEIVVYCERGDFVTQRQAKQADDFASNQLLIQDIRKNGI